MKVLVTAGSTWTKIDDVRIITNRFTGKTGLGLAQGLKKKGHSVTLLANPHCLGKVGELKIVPYYYFEEFKREVFKILKKQSYDVIIHNAAVSDYKLEKPFKGKVSSGKKQSLNLVPTEKIIKYMRILAPKSIFIQFKLEPKKRGIINKAYNSLKINKSDFVVANALEDLKDGYKGFLINNDKKVISLGSRKSLLTALNKIICP